MCTHKLVQTMTRRQVQKLRGTADAGAISHLIVTSVAKIARNLMARNTVRKYHCIRCSEIKSFEAFHAESDRGRHTLHVTSAIGFGPCCCLRVCLQLANDQYPYFVYVEESEDRVTAQLSVTLLALGKSPLHMGLFPCML